MIDRRFLVGMLVYYEYLSAFVVWYPTCVAFVLESCSGC